MFDVLAISRRTDGPDCLSPIELFAPIVVNSGTMTNYLQQLEHKALAIRPPNPNDGRNLLMTLSEQGLTNNH